MTFMKTTQLPASAKNKNWR